MFNLEIQALSTPREIVSGRSRCSSTGVFVFAGKQRECCGRFHSFCSVGHVRCEEEGRATEALGSVRSTIWRAKVVTFIVLTSDDLNAERIPRNVKRSAEPQSSGRMRRVEKNG